MNKFAGFLKQSKLVFLGAAVSAGGGGLYLSTLPIVPNSEEKKIRYGSVEKEVNVGKPQNGVWTFSVFEDGVAKKWDSNWDL